MEYTEYRNDVLALCSFVEQAEQRNAELVAALTDIRDMPEYDQDDAHRLRGMAKVFLTRAESATPAKHPDTVRINWLESQAQLGREKYHTNNAFVQCSWFPTGNDGLRAAIDAAMNGGTK